MSEPIPDRELTSLEKSLAALAPATSHIDSDQVLFQAGMAAARQATRRWRITSATLATVTLALATLLVVRPPRIEERVIYAYAAPSSSPAGEATAPKPAPVESGVAAVVPPSEPARRRGPRGTPSYLRLREDVLRNGLEALPRPSSTMAAASALSPDSRLDFDPDLPAGSVYRFGGLSKTGDSL